ncbi:MAG: ATP-binding protein [Candidatus Omnitrophota bacterium]|jgi:tRNA 2-thiocytidine biosynthesis protein TtcA
MNLVDKKAEFKGLVKYAYKTMGTAIADYGMLKDGDRVLIGVSGGSDSLLLLKLFQMRQARIPIDFEIAVCFVDTNFIKINKAALKRYVKFLGIEYIVKELKLKKSEINCFWCSWSRRKIIFEAARAGGFNKVALGHNLDDIIETTLMNLFFNGEVSTMKPKVELFHGKLTVIRPLCYLEKTKIIEAVSRFSFPDTQYDCPYGGNSARKKVREVIKNLEADYPDIKKSIFGALGRIRKDYLLDAKPREKHSKRELAVR